MKLQNYFQDPSSLHIGTEPLRATMFHVEKKQKPTAQTC